MGSDPAAVPEARLLSPAPLPRPLSEIVQGLDDSFGILTDGRRTAVHRHRTMTAALEWSHDLLEESERRLLRRLAVFGGGFGRGGFKLVTSGRTLGAAERQAERFGNWWADPNGVGPGAPPTLINWYKRLTGQQ